MMTDKADTYCGKCIKADVCGMEGVYDPATTYCAYRVEARMNGAWGKWVISEVRCPECLEYFDPECFSKEEMNKCPNCGAIMREGE